MKQQVICALMCFLAIVGLTTSCGQSDTPTQIISSTTTSDAMAEIKVTELQELNFSAEEASRSNRT